MTTKSNGAITISSVDKNTRFLLYISAFVAAVNIPLAIALLVAFSTHPRLGTLAVFFGAVLSLAVGIAALLLVIRFFSYVKWAGELTAALSERLAQLENSSLESEEKRMERNNLKRRLKNLRKGEFQFWSFSRNFS